MELKQAFGMSLKQFRQKKGLTQEDFSNVSSRTYLSTLERGLKSPTIDKVSELASVLGIHPLTLLIGSYLTLDEDLTLEVLFAQIEHEL